MQDRFTLTTLLSSNLESTVVMLNN